MESPCQLDSSVVAFIIEACQTHVAPLPMAISAHGSHYPQHLFSASDKVSLNFASMTAFKP